MKYYQISAVIPGDQLGAIADLLGDYEFECKPIQEDETKITSGLTRKTRTRQVRDKNGRTIKDVLLEEFKGRHSTKKLSRRLVTLGFGALSYSNVLKKLVKEGMAELSVDGTFIIFDDENNDEKTEAKGVALQLSSPTKLNGKKRLQPAIVAVFQHYTPSGTFSSTTAKEWLMKAGYSEHTYKGTLSIMVNEGMLDRIDHGLYRFTQPMEVFQK